MSYGGGAAELMADTKPTGFKLKKSFGPSVPRSLRLPPRAWPLRHVNARKLDNSTPGAAFFVSAVPGSFFGTVYPTEVRRLQHAESVDDFTGISSVQRRDEQQG